MPPLEGIRVLDVAGEAGAYCTKLLADLGATVIKLEPPGGSLERAFPPLMDRDPTTSLSFLHFYQSVRSVTLDPRVGAARSQFEMLVRSVDVLVDDRSSGLFEMDYPAMRAMNPGLIQASISGFGSSGPRAHWKSSDLVGQATGGLMYRVGFPEDPPNSMGEGFAYHQTSAHAAAGVLMALVHRDATGEGQLVDASLQEGIALMQYDGMPMHITKGTVIKRAGLGQGSSGKRYRRIWDCKTGRVRFQLVSQSSEREWPLVVEWLGSHGHGAELRDERWAANDARLSGLRELEEVFDRFFLTMDARALMHEAQDRGIMLMAFNEVGELANDPQLAGEGFFRTVQHVGATLTEAGPPYRFAGGLAKGGQLPGPGEHTDELLGAAKSAVRLSKAAPASTRSAPLSGLRVVDFTWVIAGPLHTKWLAAYGAEVIKIERFKKGAALNRGNMSPDSVVSFNNLNVGKQSLAVDMSFAEARETIEQLIAKSDVVVDNFGPDVLPNWGLTPERLAEINPRIISMSMPAMGKTGPHRLYKGLGSYFQARAGLDGLIGYPHRDVTDVGFAYADTTCNASHALVALLAAVHQRNATGRGEHIELRQLESAINFLGPALLEHSANGREPVRMGSRSRHLAPQGVYRCGGDDEWCVLTVANEDEWSALCQLIDKDAWLAEPGLGSVEGRVVRHGEIDAAIEAWTSIRSPDDAAGALQAVGVRAGAVMNIGEIIDHDPQIAHRGFYHRFGDDGTVEGVPFQLTDAIQALDPRVHELGEDTSAVLSEVVGLGNEAIARLFENGAVGGT